jgi:hypothetical protein
MRQGPGPAVENSAAMENTQRAASAHPDGVAARELDDAAIDRSGDGRVAEHGENPCDDIREKIFKNHALKSIDAVRAKPEEAILSMERKPEIVKSIPSFPYILKSL